MLISSFRSRAQISQLIAETTNQIKNKNKQSSKMFNTAVCLGGMPNIHIDFRKWKEKKSIFTLIEGHEGGS